MDKWRNAVKGMNADLLARMEARGVTFRWEHVGAGMVEAVGPNDPAPTGDSWEFHAYLGDESIACWVMKASVELTVQGVLLAAGRKLGMVPNFN